MVLSIHFSKFFKNTFSHKKEEESTKSTASSIHTIYEVSPSYTRDPMRCGNHPDVVGQYYDPMGGRFTLHQGHDATNTGA
ncbi:uncharacterized protein EV154DRAFT_527240 [Mucor mucedo]|uniref:Uncharacterized protein n=1 Tax=Mucor saturninus TaxID=64648 RepID=A0A8H7R8D9_9FUNG|nr:uncharacterized protein EV154DRAFT_527240 [Mucor mucedo]KAG2205575.1 hypothetical protein INT47_005950 [Mucor saturninus]KAI7874345.1 hypothetical protein EV154DRAFT_527240 [Mucor mucedo]